MIHKMTNSKINLFSLSSFPRGKLECMVGLGKLVAYLDDQLK